MNLISALAARDTRVEARDATAVVAALYAEHALGLTRQREVLVLRYYLELSRRRDRADPGDRREHRAVHRAPRAGRPRTNADRRVVMTQIENLLRAATHDAAAEVTPLTPLLAAAAAVVLVVVLSLVLSSVFAVPRPAPVIPGPIIPGVPAYYVALTATGTPSGDHPVVLTIRSTATAPVRDV